MHVRATPRQHTHLAHHHTAVTLEFKPYKISNVVDTQLDWVLKNLDSDKKDLMTLGLSLDPKGVVKKLNEKVTPDTTDAGYVAGETVGKIIWAATTACDKAADPNAVAKKTSRLTATSDATGKLTIKFAKSSQDFCSELNSAKKKKFINAIRRAISKVMKIDIGKVEISSFGSCASRRRHLLQATADVPVSYKAKDLSVAQIEAATAMSGSSSFGTSMQKNLKADPEASALGFDKTSVKGEPIKSEGEASKYLYTPKPFTPSSDVETLHGTARLQGNNVFPDFENDSSAVTEAWIMGIVLTAFPCFFCALYSVSCHCCGYCCCVKAPNTKEQPLLKSSQFIAMVIVTGLAFVGFITASTGEGKTNDAVEGLAASLEDIETFYNSVLSTVSDMGKHRDAFVATAKLTEATCDTTKDMAASFPAIPSQEIDGLAADLSNGIKDIRDANAQRAMVSSLFAWLIFLYAATYFLAVVQIKTGIPAVLRCCCNFTPKCLAPLVFINLAVLWILGGINMILSVLLSDFCITDPLVRLVELADPKGDNGLGFLVLCKGTPPEAMLSIYDVGAQMSSASLAMDGLATFISADPNGPCAATDTDKLKTELNGVITGVSTMIDNVRCKKFNEILSNVFHNAICEDFVSGALSTWLGYMFMGLSLLLGTLIYKRVEKMKKDIEILRKIYPEQEAQEAVILPMDPVGVEEAYPAPIEDAYEAANAEAPAYENETSGGRGSASKSGSGSNPAKTDYPADEWCARG